LSESENNKEFSLSEGSLLEKEKVLGSNPAPSTNRESQYFQLMKKESIS